MNGKGGEPLDYLIKLQNTNGKVNVTKQETETTR